MAIGADSWMKVKITVLYILYLVESMSSTILEGIFFTKTLIDFSIKELNTYYFLKIFTLCS